MWNKWHSGDEPLTQSLSHTCVGSHKLFLQCISSAGSNPSARPQVPNSEALGSCHRRRMNTRIASQRATCAYGAERRHTGAEKIVCVPFGHYPMNAVRSLHIRTRFRDILARFIYSSRTFRLCGTKITFTGKLPSQCSENAIGAPARVERKAHIQLATTRHGGNRRHSPRLIRTIFRTSEHIQSYNKEQAITANWGFSVAAPSATYRSLCDARPMHTTRTSEKKMRRSRCKWSDEL